MPATTYNVITPPALILYSRQHPAPALLQFLCLKDSALVWHERGTAMKIIVIGKPDLQTDHWISLLRSNITDDCRLLGLHSMPTVVSPDTLFILDLAVLEPSNCAGMLASLQAHGMRRAALINVDASVNHQTQLAALPGVCGLFARNASPEDFIRGIKAIVNGEYWLPRQVLCEHLEQTRHKIQPGLQGDNIKLSPKERQLLNLLTQGCSNDAIAHHLAISPHTVKAHFYNLYRKLQVHNRVQAVTWVQQHSDAMNGRL